MLGFLEDLVRAVLQGTPPGAVFALIALGFVLTYKTSGVFNLAFGAQAYVSAAMYFQAKVTWGWPIIPALILSVFILAPAIGLVLERFIFRPLRTASAVAKLVVAVGLTVALPAMFELIMGFSAVAGQTPEGILPNGAGVFYDPFGLYPWSRNEIAQLVVAVGALLIMGALFRFTAISLNIRAVVESSRMTELAGINADRVSAFSWAISSMFAGLAGVLIAPRFNTLISPDFFAIMVVAIAAAAIGQLLSLEGAVIGGLALGIAIALLNTFLPRFSDNIGWLGTVADNLTPAVPFLVLFAVIVFWPAKWRPREVADPLAGVDPPVLSPSAHPRTARATWIVRGATALFLGLCAIIVVTQLDVSWLFLVTQAVIMSTIFLSITVVTGMGGQISLCQGTFAAIGGFTVFQLADRHGMSSLAGALIGAVIAGIVGGLLAIPLRRLNGIWIAIATLAFAYFFDAVLVKMSWVGGGGTSLLQGTRVPRPTLGPIDFASDKSFLALAIVVFALTALVVIQLREGTLGMKFRALRSSELAAASIGISSARARVTLLAASAAIAGLGGAMLSMQQKNVNYGNNFSPAAGLFWLVIVVTLSARTVEGAAYAGAGFSLFERAILKNVFHLSGKWRFVLFGLTAIQFARHPEGLLENGKRKSAERNARIKARLTRGRAPTPPSAPEPPAAVPVPEEVGR